MSIELEKLLHEAGDAGVVFMTRFGHIQSIKTIKGPVSPAIMDRIRAKKTEIERYMMANHVGIRCFECPQSEMCQDGTACRHPPYVGSSQHQ